MIKVYGFKVSRDEWNTIALSNDSMSVFENREELAKSFKGINVDVLAKISDNTSLSLYSDPSDVTVLLMLSGDAVDKFDKLFIKYYNAIYKLVTDVAEKAVVYGHVVRTDSGKEVCVYAEYLKASVDSIIKEVNANGSLSQMADVAIDVNKFKDYLDSLDKLKSGNNIESNNYKWSKGTIPQSMFNNTDGAHRFGEYDIPSVEPRLIKISEANNSKVVKVFKFNTDCVDEFEASINQYVSSRKVVSINTEVVNNIIIVIVLTEEK